jgi:hypothetical protein
MRLVNQLLAMQSWRTEDLKSCRVVEMCAVPDWPVSHRMRGSGQKVLFGAVMLPTCPQLNSQAEALASCSVAGLTQ